MNETNLKVSNILFLLLTLCSLKTIGQVKLPQLISDGMILQRDTRVALWGWASPGEKISITVADQRVDTVAAPGGKWLVHLKPVKAGGPYRMDISSNNHITINDILFGDVWFCSGQSNMVVPMERVKEKYPDEIIGANFPQIRNFFIPTISDVTKLHDDLPSSKWMSANPTNVLDFGAASYFFAKKLYLKYHVPIGIINSSVGGTPIQAWVSEDGLKKISNYAGRVAQFKDTTYVNQLLRPAGTSGIKRSTTKQTDKGLAGPVKWYESVYSPTGWHKFWLPGYWADQGVKGLNGIVWFRKTINIPKEMAGKPAKLFLGRIIDADETYVNGKQVGNITYQYPPRRYEIPVGLLKAGANTITVRITNTSGKGGFVPDKRYELTDGQHSLDLRGEWLYQVGQVFPPSRPYTDAPRPFSAQNEPTGLYNTMINPVTHYTIKGFLWYQGESNTGKPKEYNDLLPALITDWRSKWGAGDLPFVYVQLPNFGDVQYWPAESQTAELREAQLHGLRVSNSAMAVTIDVGEWNDIHPINKKDVGERSALAAEKIAYGETTLVSSGPIYQAARIDEGKIMISFSNVGSGLMVKGGGDLNQFAIAGDDKKFIWANAKITGDQVVIWSDEVPNPKYVRYAWADNPDNANLYNKNGLPASPFRTDNQP
ncbi:MAG: 9-O-acetylesterase [Mucilaginibacter sp.]|nr:9-O-acetylesterase [Mucilaginibacter sp.]